MKHRLGCAEALAAPKPIMTTDMPIVLVAAAAIIDRKKQILMAQRPEGKPMAGLWEFPGGKVNAGELPEYALMRELEEELGIETRPCCMSAVGFASHTYEKFHLLMPVFAIRVWKGEPTPREGQNLKWMNVLDLYSLEMPEADKPLIHQLEAIL